MIEKIDEGITEEIVIISRYGSKNSDKPQNHRGLDDKAYVSNFRETELIIIHKKGQSKSECEIFSVVLIGGDPPAFIKQTIDERMNKLSNRNERLTNVHDRFYTRMAKYYTKVLMLRVNVPEEFTPNSHNDNIE